VNPLPRVTSRERLVVAVTAIAFLLLLVLWALTAPMFQAPDEAAHVDAVVRLALGHGWPATGHMHFLRAVDHMVSSAPTTGPSNRPSVAQMLATYPGFAGTVDQMSQHPPVWYSVLAGVLRLAHFAGHRWDVTVTLLRLVDAVVVAPLPVFVWATVRRLTGARRLALIAPLGLLAVPELAQVAGSATVLAPTLLLGGVLVWLAARVLTHADRWVSVVGLGACAAALAWCNALGLVAAVFAVVVPLAVRDSPWSRRLGGAGLVLVVVVLLGGWWWAHQLLTTGTVQPDGLGAADRPVAWGDGTTRDLGSFFDTQWNGLTLTFWGDLGAYRFPLSPILVDVGLCWGATRRYAAKWNSSVLLLLPALTLVAVMVRNWEAYGRLHTISSQQGRLLFVAVVALIAVEAAAWAALIERPDLRRRAARWFIVAAAAVGAYGFSLLYRGGYQATDLGVTRAGLALLRNTTPFGGFVYVGVALLAAAAVLTTLVACWHLSATPLPLDSRTVSGETDDHQPRRKEPLP
jgi:hypothetical protein